MRPGFPPFVAPLAGTFAVQAAAAAAAFSVPVFAPEAAPAIGIPATWIGAFTAVLYVFGMVSGLVTGPFVLRYGAIRVCQASMLLSALGMAAIALAWPWAAVASAVFLGLSYGPVNPASSHILVRVAPPKSRPLIFSIKQTGVTAGGAVAGAVVPPLVLLVGWQAAALVLGALALVILVAVQPLRRQGDVERDPGRRLFRGIGVAAPLRLVFKAPRLRRIALSAFAYAGCQVCVSAFFVIYLADGLGMPLVRAGLIFSVMQVGGIGGRILWGAIAERLLPSRIVLALLGLMMAGGCAATAAFAPDWPLAVILGVAVVLGATSFGWNGVALSEVARLAPKDRTSDATGGMQFIMFGGCVVLPPIFGAAIGASGGYMLPFLAIAVVTAAVCAYLLLPPGGQDSEAA